MAKAEKKKKIFLFTSKSDSNLRNKLVKCYIWSIALYGAETSKSRSELLKIFEVWCWVKMKKISLTNYVRNEILQRVKEGIIYLQ
jgi:hypothetical protein